MASRNLPANVSRAARKMDRAGDLVDAAIDALDRIRGDRKPTSQEAKVYSMLEDAVQFTLDAKVDLLGGLW